MLLGGKRYKWYEGDTGGNTSGTPAIASAENNVQSAISNVTEAVAEAPNKAMEDLLSSVKDVLGGVTAELKRANDLAEKAATPAPVPDPEPEVEIPTPKPTTRTVRRNGRKVTKVMK